MKPAIVLGGAIGVFAELERARAMAGDVPVIACNQAGAHLKGRLDIWATMHPELLPKWIEFRRAVGEPDAGELWSAEHRVAPKGLELRRMRSPGGSSGLLCVAIAMHLGFDRIMLCGVPMAQQGAHFDRPARKWFEARQYWPAWQRMNQQLEPCVRSFSGYTMQWFGEPTKEWLDGALEGTETAARIAARADRRDFSRRLRTVR